MAIQHRRGAYADFDPSKMKPGEPAAVLSGDPSSSDGKAAYIAFGPGSVKRLATMDDIQEEIYTQTEEIIEQIQEGIADDVERAETAASDAEAAAASLKLDTTLTIQGRAADAKAAGDKIKAVSEVTAETFSTSKAYAVGDYVIYNNALYKFITAHSAGAWNSAHVSATAVSDEIADLKDLSNSFVSRFYGKKLSIIGDSIDTFDQAGYKIDGYNMYYPSPNVPSITSVEQTWWKKVINASGMTLEKNASWSGSRVTNTHPNPTYPDFYARVSVIGTPDVVFVTLGTNDSGNNITLGEYDFNTTYTSLSESTFRTAYIKGVKALQASYPNAQIVCISEGMGNAYKESIAHIADVLNVMYIDASEYSVEDGFHPGESGMRQIASSVLFPIDKTLTQKNIPTDGKIVGDIKKITDNIQEILGGEEQREITGWTHEKYINVATPNIGDTVDITNVSSYWSLKYVIVNCEAGDKFLLNLAGAASARAWAFLTSSNVLISRADASVTLTDVTITAPQNAGKAIFQCIYRQTPEDTTTDDGTAYKFVQGTGNVVRFDIVQDKTEAEKARARENIGVNGTGDGLTDEAKAAFLNCFAHVAWVDTHGQDYYDALYNALYGGISSNISVEWHNEIERMFFTDDPVDSLKYHLTVTYNDEVTTDYELVGSLANNNVRVKIGNEYSSVIPIEAREPAYSWSIGDNLTGSPQFGVGGTISSQGERPWAQSNTYRGLLGTATGRIKYGGSEWRLIPVPADATKAIITCQPSTVAFGATNWLFNPLTNIHDYNGADTGWLTTGTTYNIPDGDLRAMSINFKNTNDSTFTANNIPSSFTIEFLTQ